ncbi:hypothetical protein NHX12_002147 [Muraenolepis orangiensis]|uniref:Extracellular matrix protein 1 n=1 Tax=Muraenolepis orangiensis TaxID=630683 RepID=A0A9Q0E113_9TELE|nr:hypothetical protein NHX12_002147 [Muraenolepis orangiensis]
MDWFGALVCACVGLGWIGEANGEGQIMVEQMLLDPIIEKEDMEEIMRGLSENGPPAFGPRSFAMGPPSLMYPVQFPPGRPTANNLQAICLYGDHRPRYPDDYFPYSGFGQLRRRALAVNLAELLFSECCAANQTRGSDLTLCCVRQAWKQMVATFCELDTSVKDRIYHCCKEQDAAQLKCFQEDAPNTTYLPTEELPVFPVPVDSSFLFNHNACPKSTLTPRSVRSKIEKTTMSSQNVSISFPPARPTADDIQSVCVHRKLRPFYDHKCLPHKGYGWLVRQTKAINRVERGFKQCCKSQQEVLQCADGKWREQMDKFCKEEKMMYHCCEIEAGHERYECFQSSAPSSGYDVDPSTTASPVKNTTLGQICDTHKLIKKKLLAGLPVHNFVKQCCHLPSKRKTVCIQQKIMSKGICSTRRAPYTAKCCTPSADSTRCITKILTNAISKTLKLPLRKKKCPLS